MKALEALLLEEPGAGLSQYLDQAGQGLLLAPCTLAVPRCFAHSTCNVGPAALLAINVKSQAHCSPQSPGGDPHIHQSHEYKGQLWVRDHSSNMPFSKIVGLVYKEQL